VNSLTKALISNWEMKGDQFQSNKMKGKLRNVRLEQLYWRFRSVILTQILNSWLFSSNATKILYVIFSSKLAIDHNRHLENGEIIYILVYSISYMARLPVSHGRLCLNHQFSLGPKFRLHREQKYQIWWPTTVTYNHKWHKHWCKMYIFSDFNQNKKKCW
jgi:hypothetical protein